jgi:hypothetical protein
MKKIKRSKKEQRKKWAEHQAVYLATHPEQVWKKALRSKARRAKEKAAKVIDSAASEASSLPAKKVSTR